MHIDYRTLTPVLVLLALLLAGCATTSTQLAEVSDEEVELEKHKQRQLVLQTLQHQQARLIDVAYPILRDAASLCGEDTAPVTGLQLANAYAHEKGKWREAARDGLDLNETLKVVGVAAGSGAEKAGLRPGDRLIEIGDQPVRQGEDAIEEAQTGIRSFLESNESSLPIVYHRQGQNHSATIETEEACSYPVSVVQESGLNAFADGEAMYVTSAMMRFADDDELAVIISHELAHNAMRHIEAKKQNAAAGALFGALGDIAMASAGVNTGGYYTSEFAGMGAEAYSQDFEREADYVGMYALALAGESLEAAPELWRHMAMANPESIGLAHTHPTTAERFVRLERAIDEIEQKIEEGDALKPTMEK